MKNLCRMVLTALLVSTAAGPLRASGPAKIYGEPGRLARPILFLAQRGAFTDAEWTGWFQALASPAPFDSWGEVFASQAGLAKLHNTKAFAQEVYVSATASGEPALTPLASSALALLEVLP